MKSNDVTYGSASYRSTMDREDGATPSQPKNAEPQVWKQFDRLDKVSVYIVDRLDLLTVRLAPFVKSGPENLRAETSRNELVIAAQQLSTSADRLEHAADILDILLRDLQI